MNDTQIAKICFIIAVVGIVLLFAYTEMLEPQKTSVSGIDASFVGKKVAVEGVAKSVRTNDGAVFIKLADRGEIDVVVFERTAEKHPFLRSIRESSPIRVIGKVENYNNGLEIVAERVELIR